MTPEQQRLIAILQYLEDWDMITRTPVTNVQDYRAGLVAFQRDIAEMPDVGLNLLGPDGEAVWMEVPRLTKTEPPAVENDLRPWVVLKNDPSSEPRHLNSIKTPPAKEGDESGEMLFTEEIQAHFDQYVSRRWRPWADVEKKKRRCIALYEKLFHLQQVIQNAGVEAPTEVVWGMGMVVWNTAGQRICHPIVTQQVEILPLAGDMCLRLRPTSRNPQVETDPFLPLEIPELRGFEKSARALLKELAATPSPFEPESFSVIATSAAGQLGTSGRYWPNQPDYVPGALPEASSTLLITDSWVLFARKRNTNLLVEDLNGLREATIENGVPEGAPSYLVEEPAGALPEPPEIHYRGLSTAGISGTTGTPNELFFPKPFNDEQVEIIRRLETLPGVVVQGPPGTGKTHTIANVICHYLALGKRVLVTSKGETALSVLQNQIPEQIRELTVSLLTNESQGKEQLEHAVNNINTKLNTLRASDLKATIASLDEEIEGLHQRIASIDFDLRSWAWRNTEKAPGSIGGLAPEALAREVCALESQHGWFPDALDHRADHDLSITDSELQTLTAARRSLHDKLEYANVPLPLVACLPSVAQIGTVHQNLCEQGGLAVRVDRSSIPRLPANDEVGLTLAGRLHQEVRDHVGLISQCEAAWLADLRVKFRQSKHSGEHQANLDALEALKAKALELHQSFSVYVATAIELPDGAKSDETFRVAIERASQGKPAFSLFQLGCKISKQAFQQIKLNGKKPGSSEEWKLVSQYCAILDQAETLVHQWNKLASGLGAPIIDSHPEAAISQLASYAKSVEGAMMLAFNYDLTLVHRVVQVFPTIHAERIQFEHVFLTELDESLGIQLRHWQLATSKNTAISLFKALESLDGDLFARMRGWVTTCLGNFQYPASDIAEDWGAFLSELEHLHEKAGDFETVRRVTGAIHQNGATEWAGRLATEPVMDGADTLLPSTWRATWQWSRQRGYLQAIDGRAWILKLTMDRRESEERLRRTYESVIGDRTWLRLLENIRLDKAITRAITAYVQAIRGMTKSGKGKRDVQLRHAAREAMHLASRGVPCWIMPQWRVSETLPPRLGDFDLVIVDEASQSDAWAVPAIIRGKKVLIVGDDKQVGPQPSFTRQEQIDQIQERLAVAGLPLDIRHRLDPKESIYDLGELVFAGHTIRLREHFRCAEPIIEFSNKLCYDGEIKCMRVPTAAERLLPTLIDVHVRSGRRDPVQKINRAEADAIVDEIGHLVIDPAFGERSIGVVSLLGPEQGKLIFDTVLERIGAEKFLKHRIRCGDARTFQGSEADVIFISAVDDPNTGAVMTSNKLDNIRRINVAVSRARDRLYFVHSFSREDLSGLDLRARLLDHFKSPIRGLADAKGRDLCESGFEREMFDVLTERGFRAIPQVRAGNYRIDFVIEGHNGKRLAVECDGDQFHGPDKWMDDIRRQRLLERAGWKFWRCWGSSFARDRMGCIEDLMKTLKDEGIEPLGDEALDFSGIVEFREITALDEDSPVGDNFEEFSGDTPEVDSPDEDQSQGAHKPADQPDIPSIPVTTPPSPAPNPAADAPQVKPRNDPRAEQPETKLCAEIALGDAVRYRVTDARGTREEYIVLLNQPTSWKLGIASVDEPISKCLLGRKQGDGFEADLDGTHAKIEVLMTHKVDAKDE